MSTDGGEWRRFGEADVNLPAATLIGLAVCSHHNGRLNKALVDHVGLTVP